MKIRMRSIIWSPLKQNISQAKAIHIQTKEFSGNHSNCLLVTKTAELRLKAEQVKLLSGALESIFNVQTHNQFDDAFNLG